MKKLLLLFSAALTMLFTGCTQFDDSRIWDAIDELEDLYDDLDGRLEKLEEECQKMNTNIEALQTLVTALQNHDTITSIAPIKQGDEIVGYTITFSQSEPITIYHGTDGKDGTDGEDGKDGADGKDGYTPTIGVAQDEDGAYYWTLDGEWLLDENGNKIKAVGEDGKDGANGNDGANGENGTNGENGENGKDGITPQLEIRDGYWYISYDNGATWKELGKATGEDGKDGADGEDGKDGEDGTNGTDGQDGKDGDSLFQSVTWDEEYAYFTLADGTVITIPLLKPEPKSNEIQYTSTDGKIVKPYNSRYFGANIISNTYEDGKGIITFDGDVTEIGDYAFYKCSSLTSITIPEGVTSIGREAFYCCSNLTNVNIPKGVTTIGVYAFNRCDKLTEFTSELVSSDGRCLIRDGELFYLLSSGLTEYTIPNSVVSIGEYAIASENLTSIIIPNSVTEIKNCAFFDCENLASITIPNSIASIDCDAFYYCTNLTEFKGALASSDGRCLIKDGELLLFLPANLTEYTIPDEVTTIINHIDYGELEKLTIPESVTTFGSGSIFMSCDVKELVINCNIPDPVPNQYGGVFTYCGVQKVTIGNGVTSIGEYAFSQSENLTSVSLPNSITSIGAMAFWICSSLTSINIPEGLTSIEGNTFGDCTSLTSIDIPDSVTSLGGFSGCTNLTSITIPEGVTEIYSDAFSNCTSLTSITIPEGVTTMGSAAFDGCSNLVNVYCRPIAPPVFDEDYYWGAFDNNAEGRKIFIPAEMAIAYLSNDDWKDYSDSFVIYDFEAECEVEFVVGEGDKPANNEIWYTSTNGKVPYMYFNYGEMETFGANITANVYWKGKGVIMFDDEVTSIGDSAFGGCSSLASITFPNSVTSIGDYAFYYSVDLTRVNIPESVTSIGNSAFYYCDNLAEVYCEPTTPPTAEFYDGEWRAFNYNASGRKIYVPTESVEAYKAADGWSEYADYIEPYVFE